MATSGSVDFSVTRNEIITAALQQIGVVGEGEVATSAQISESSLLLNALVKARMSDGMPLWALKEGFILPTTETSAISLGGVGNNVTAYVTTNVTNDATAGDTTLTLDSVTGISSTYAIGISQGDSTVFWTTVNGAPVGDVVTLTAAITEDVSAGAIVYAYSTTNRITRPLRVISAYMIDTAGDNRFPINVVSKDEWLSLGTHDAQSVPNQVWYDPQLVNGVLHVYPQFYTGDYVMEITYHRPFEDFDASTDTPDFPQEWYLSIIMDLAALLGGKYGVPISERRELKQEAQMWHELALSNGTEEGSFRMTPDTRWRTGHG